MFVLSHCMQTQTASAFVPVLGALDNVQKLAYDAKNEELINATMNLFLALAEVQDISQLRYIDRSGMEIVRIDCGLNHECHPTPSERLQYKVCLCRYAHYRLWLGFMCLL